MLELANHLICFGYSPAIAIDSINTWIDSIGAHKQVKWRKNIRDYLTMLMMLMLMISISDSSFLTRRNYVTLLHQQPNFSLAKFQEKCTHGLAIDFNI